MAYATTIRGIVATASAENSRHGLGSLNFPAAKVDVGFWPAGEAVISSRAQAGWVIGVTCAFALALGWMFFWMAAQSRQIVIDDTYQSSSNLALSVEQFVARTMETIELSQRIVLEEIGPEGLRASAEIRRLLAARVRQSPQITMLAVIGRDGRVQASSTTAAQAPLDAAREEYFVAARNNNALHFTVEKDIPAQRKPRVFVSRRFDRPDGSFAGVIVATLSADYMQQFFSTLHVGEYGIIALETTDGTMLLRQPDLDGYVGRNFGTSPLFKEWLPWASSGVFVMPYAVDGRLRVVGYQRVEKQPLVVQVALAKDEALAHWRRTTIVQAAVALAILVLAGVAAYMLNRELRARLVAHERLRRTVDELERARFAAEESSRVKSQFMANMSHELRTPLNAVIGYSEILLEDAKIEGRKECVADLRRINSAGQHLLEMIDDVLDVSAIEVGGLELREEKVELAKLIEDCRHAIARSVNAADLRLSTALPPQPLLLLGDEKRLRQIVLNLLSNAVKFTLAGGQIALAVTENGAGGLDIAVSDSGIGMKPEEIPLALEAFRQLDVGLNRRYEGTGLGLPLARHLAELHGGTLHIESAPGEGTKVTFTLPASRVEKAVNSQLSAVSSTEITIEG
jgi:signal transduction histidine kinase